MLIPEVLKLNLISVDVLSDLEEDDDDPESYDNQPQGQPSTSVPCTSNTYSPSISTNITHLNYPYLCEIYKDPENQLDKVLLAVNVPGGAQNVKLELNTEGTAVTLKYNWAKIMYDMDDMFKTAIASKKITSYHPKILSLKGGLEKRRPRIDVAPESIITINLPIRVQTGADSWTKSGAMREDGSQVVMGDFSGFVKEYQSKISDANVIFDN